jgi:hypothetical protein
MKQCYFPGITRGTAGALSTLAAAEWGIVPATSSMISTDGFTTDLTGYIGVGGATDPSLEALKFKLVTRRSSTDLNFYCSPAFSLSQITKYSYVPYSAGTAQVTTITPVLPATQYTGDVYSIKLIDLTTGTQPMLRKTFQVVHVGTDFTTTTVMDAFRTLINADEDFSFVVATGTTTLILTLSKDYTLATATDDLASVFTTVLTTKMIPSTGTLAKITALEQECNSYQYGVYNKVLFPKTAPSKMQPSQTTFDQYILEIANPFSPVDGSKMQANNPLKLYIVETAGATNSFGDLLKAAFPTNLGI